MNEFFKLILGFFKKSFSEPNPETLPEGVRLEIYRFAKKFLSKRLFIEDTDGLYCLSKDRYSFPIVYVSKDFNLKYGRISLNPDKTIKLTPQEYSFFLISYSNYKKKMDEEDLKSLGKY